MILNMISTIPQHKNAKNFGGVWWRLLCTAMAIVAGISEQDVATAESTPDYVYFMDAFTSTNVQNTPANIAVIGETEATGAHARSTLTAGGRIVGTQTEFNTSSHITWTHALNTLFNSTAPDLSTQTLRQQFALQVLLASGISADPPGAPSGGYPVPADDEWVVTPAGGYVLYTQDIEGPVIPLETAAAITAVMWASREYLGPKMKIIPVPANALIIEETANWNLKTVVEGSSSNKWLSYLPLKNTLSSADQTALDANQIDLFSFLHLASAEGHPLVDGILPMMYSRCGPQHTEVCCGPNMPNYELTAPPGSLNIPSPPFYDTTLPYAILSAHDNPAQLSIVQNPDCPSLVPPWDSHHHGAMPFLAGVYWDGAVDPSFLPSDYLTPTVVASDDASSCQSDLDGDLDVDGGDLGIMFGSWGPVNRPTDADINGDFRVDGADLGMLLNEWGNDCGDGTSPPWISVLIAQYAPDTDPALQQIYVNKIKKLAPNLEQIHLRIPSTKNAPESHPDIPAFVHLIGLFRTAYGSTLKIGFHPDNDSHTSCQSWACTSTPCDSTNTAAWHCVLDKSIRTMNAMNLLADSNGSGNGFTIFSIEQSYVEPIPGSVEEIKHTLSGGANPIPGVTVASPPVAFGYVAPSHGGSDLYGPDGFDYGYPQYYNKGKALTDDAQVLIQGRTPYFPAPSAQDCLPTPSNPCKVPPIPPVTITVVDVDTPGAYLCPKIPCFNQSLVQNVYTSLPDGSSGASPAFAASYLAYIMTQLPPISNTVNLGGSEVFITLSGEPDILGAPGWTIENINEFNAQLVLNFATLKNQVPSLFPSGGTDPTTLKYGIWSFEAILENITLP
jgi:hypothetical protein